jgi:hypothetical protein
VLLRARSPPAVGSESSCTAPVVRTVVSSSESESSESEPEGEAAKLPPVAQRRLLEFMLDAMAK